MERSKARLALLFATVTLLIPLNVWAGPAASDSVFRDLILTRIRAYGRGDYLAYSRLIDPRFVHISDLGERRTRSQIRAFVSGHGDNHETYVISDLSFRVQGELAVVYAKINEHSADHDGALMETDVFVWRHGRWLYSCHQETSVFQTPKVWQVSVEKLNDYPGRYVSSGGIVDLIAVRGADLVAQAPGDAEAVVLLPVGPDAFALPNDPAVVFFIRGKTGAVTHCIWHLPSGQVTIENRNVEAAQGVR